MHVIIGTDLERSRKAAERHAHTAHLVGTPRWRRLRRRIAWALLPAGDRAALVPVRSVRSGATAR